MFSGSTFSFSLSCRVCVCVAAYVCIWIYTHTPRVYVSTYTSIHICHVYSVLCTSLYVMYGRTVSAAEQRAWLPGSNPRHLLPVLWPSFLSSKMGIVMIIV